VRRNGQVHGRGRAPAIQFESPRSPTSSTRQGNSPKMARVSAVQREMEENGTKRPVFVCTEWSSTTAPTSFSVAASDGHSAWRLEEATYTQSVFSREEWLKQAGQALRSRTLPDGNPPASVSGQGELQLNWNFSLGNGGAGDAPPQLLLWKLVLPSVCAADASAVTARVMSTLLKRMQSLEDEQRSLQTTFEQQTAELMRNNTVMARYEAEKDAFEQDKFSAFAALLNSKKERIRQLEKRYLASDEGDEATTSDDER